VAKPIGPAKLYSLECWAFLGRPSIWTRPLAGGESESALTATPSNCGSDWGRWQPAPDWDKNAAQCGRCISRGAASAAEPRCCPGRNS
jgi:hypothetical protein